MKAFFEKTPRNFEIIRFSDHYDQQCMLQQSSLAHYEQPGSSCLWIGLSDVKPNGHPMRMHLTLGQVQWLIHQLQHWEEHGRFDPNELERQDWPPEQGEDSFGNRYPAGRSCQKCERGIADEAGGLCPACQADRGDRRTLIDDLAKRFGMNRSEVLRLFRQALRELKDEGGTEGHD